MRLHGLLAFLYEALAEASLGEPQLFADALFGFVAASLGGQRLPPDDPPVFRLLAVSGGPTGKQTNCQRAPQSKFSLSSAVSLSSCYDSLSVAKEGSLKL